MPWSPLGAVVKRERRILRAAVVSVLLWPVFAWMAARALMVESPLSNSDAIVVLANASALEERTRRAAQLFLDGRAARILVTNENLRSRWSDLHQRNLYTYEWEVEELQRGGVPADVIEVLHQPVGSTYEEALEAKRYALQHGLTSVLIVTSAYHSRRSLWVFQKV
ncbi:MAG TPA: YdcF family protein, partial [Pyrinomonadaceae bacterium]|nr:YdcF family protein [Pyrinomonadaceae bacterium]